MEEVVDFKIAEVHLVSTEVVLQEGTLAVNRLSSDSSQPLLRPSSEVPALVLEVTWCVLTPAEKMGAHRREERWAEMHSGGVCDLLCG